MVKKILIILMIVLAGLVSYICIRKDYRDFAILAYYVVLKPIPENFVGTRSLAEGKTKVQIPWYRVDLDYNFSRAAYFWKRIPVLSGTKAAYIARYCDVGYYDSFDDATEMEIRFKGFDFGLINDFGDECIVKPGPGTEEIHMWFYEDQEEGSTTSFRESIDNGRGPFYIFCFDHQPGPHPSDYNSMVYEMEQELDHIVGIIEVTIKIDFSDWPISSPLKLTQENLLTFREESTDPAEPELIFGVQKKDVDSFEYLTPEGKLPAKPEIIQKLLYAFNTCLIWKEIEEYPDFDEGYTTRTLITYLDEKGEKKEAEILFHDQLYLKLLENKYYSTWYPDLLEEIEEEIEKEIDDALPLLAANKAVELNPEDYKAYSNRAALYNERREADLAIQDLNRAIELNPDNAELYTRRGEVYLEMDKTDLAILDYNTVIKIDPDSAAAYENRANCFRYLGDMDKACSDWKRACELAEDWACDRYNDAKSNGNCTGL